jgi:alanine-glyoxylate transaminase/serine-glyoxylate transaminase/serine-pyruvate transaminase
MKQESLKLMIPGPIQPAKDVLEAMGSPVRAHYGPAWIACFNETLDLLRKVYATRGDVFIMVGSGTVAIDACLGSALSAGEKILIGMNGFFGDRLKLIAESYGLVVVPVIAEWGEVLDPAAFEAAFLANPDAKMVALVHLETSTTVVNPIQAVAKVARRYGALVMVDAVSSLGGLPMRLDDWGIDLCPSASQKCLGAPPGLATVAVSQCAWEVIDRNPNKGHGWYGDLRVWRQYAIEWGDWHPSPITMATNNVMALHASLEGLLAEGIDARLERYCRLASRLRAGLRRIGMPPFTSDELLAPVLTAALCPPGVSSGKIVEYMENVHRIKISGGLGTLKEKMIRIGHMSPTLNEGDIDEVIDALGEYPA